MKYQIDFANSNTARHFGGKEFSNETDAKIFYDELQGGFKTNQDALVTISDDNYSVEYSKLS